MRAVVIAHGDVDPGDRVHLEGADLIVAADGGTLALERWNFVPHAIVGDLDSLGVDRAAEYATQGVTVVPTRQRKTNRISSSPSSTPPQPRRTTSSCFGILGGARGSIMSGRTRC
jgi:hypothetical protein